MLTNSNAAESKLMAVLRKNSIRAGLTSLRDGIAPNELSLIGLPTSMSQTSATSAYERRRSFNTI